MKPALYALVAAAALFISTGTAGAQPRYSTFHTSVVPSQSLSPATLSTAFPASTPYPSSGLTLSGNFGMGVGNGYYYPSRNYNSNRFYPTNSYSSYYNPGYYNPSYSYPTYYYGMPYSGSYYGWHQYGFGW
jgi:hypothetical protein